MTDKEIIVKSLWDLQKEFEDKNIPINIKLTFNGYACIKNNFTATEIRGFMNIIKLVNMNTH